MTLCGKAVHTNFGSLLLGFNFWFYLFLQWLFKLVFPSSKRVIITVSSIMGHSVLNEVACVKLYHKVNIQKYVIIGI